MIAFIGGNSLRMTPRISIITPTYNCASLIERCIASVQAQGYQNFEHIVIDGASADGTVEVLKRYPHIRWISEKDTGEANALNKALSMVTGDLVCWLNADDWHLSGAWSAVVEQYVRTPQAVLYADAQMVDEQGDVLWTKRCASQCTMQTLVRWWLNSSHPHQPSMFFPRGVLQHVGRFNEELHFSIDYEYWLRCAVAHPFVHVPVIASCAMQRADCKSAGTEPQQIQSHWKVLWPYLQSWSFEERTVFWRDYYADRLQHPLPFEATRAPDSRESLAGLCGTLSVAESPDAAIAALFLEEQQLNQVVQQVEEFFRAEQRALELPRKFAERTAPTAPTVLMPPVPKRMKIAGQDDLSGHDLTQIDGASEFAKAIAQLFQRIRPTKIIETGTYLGTGTTKIIAQTIRDLGLQETRFYSIEVNPDNYRQAQINLASQGLLPYVSLLQGLSLPRPLLPSVDEIEQRLVKQCEGDGIFVDHAEHERARLYHQETHFDGCPEDLLRRCLAEVDFKPDFVLLDSGGHIGNVEFNYLLSLLQGPCHIALDDVHHVKHHRSFKQLKADPRFTIVTESSEKFGFCLAAFDPARGKKPDLQGKQVLWVRTDSIGDALLSASMLPYVKQLVGQGGITVLCQEHIAELYRACPFVGEVIPFRRQELETSESYLNQVISQLTSRRFDVAINSVFSRDAVSDVVTLASGAAVKIGWNASAVDVPAEVRAEHNRLYTVLVEPRTNVATELQRHEQFLLALGGSATGLAPRVWTTPEDEAAAEQWFQANRVDSSKAVALFCGAQESVRHYESYGAALAPVCREQELTVIALGAASDAAINQRNLAPLAARTVNLSGQLTLRQAAAVLRRCRLAVGAETGLAHLACAVGTQNVVLLGGGHFGRFMPYSGKTLAVALPLTCFGCNWRCQHQRPHCVQDLQPGVLEQAIRIAWGGDSTRPRVLLQPPAAASLAIGLRWQRPALPEGIACEWLEADVGAQREGESSAFRP